MNFLLSSGDPTGVGPEICLKFLVDLFETKKAKEQNNTFLALKKGLRSGEIVISIIGHQELFIDLIQRYGLPLNFVKTQRYAFLQHQSEPLIKVDFIPLEFPPSLSPIIAEFFKKKNTDLQLFYQRLREYGAGQFSLQILHKVANLLKLKRYDGVITAPVNKSMINRELIANKTDHLEGNYPTFFKGHTEFFAETFAIQKYKMVFFSPVFDLVLLTTHLPLAEVEQNITPAGIENAIEQALTIQRMTKDQNPIIVMGVNPHAGENGQIGKIDLLLQKIITQHQQKGINIVGPFSADSAFVWVYQKKYRTVIAAYHDQGLIPLKMIAKGTSINVTMGLPFIRTSVDHGTAYDIAGKNQAEAIPLMYAVEQARKLYEFNH